MKNIIYSLFITFILTSCGNNVQTVTVDSTNRYFDYSIGLGETIHIGRLHDYDIEDSVLQAVPDDHVLNEEHIIKSITLSDGSKLDDEILSIEMGDKAYDFNATCLGSFNAPIHIDYIQYYFPQSDFILNLKYNVEFSYNENFLTNPIFSNETINRYFLEDHTYYFLLRKAFLYLSNDDSFIINSFASSNTLLKLEDKQWAPNTPYVRSEGTLAYLPFVCVYKDLNYEPFHAVDLNDYSDYRETDGIALKFNLVISDDLDSLGTDILFNVTLNGDNYIIPYHMQYDRENMY